VGGLSPPSRSRSRQHWGSKGCGRTKSALPIPMKSSSSLDPMSREGRANEALLRGSKGVGGLSPPCRSRRCFTHTIPSIKLPPCGLQNDIYRLPLCGHENSYLYIYIYIYIYCLGQFGQAPTKLLASSAGSGFPLLVSSTSMVRLKGGIWRW
jgi:hypothetical protein